MDWKWECGSGKSECGSRNELEAGSRNAEAGMDWKLEVGMRKSERSASAKLERSKCGGTLTGEECILLVVSLWVDRFI